MICRPCQETSSTAITLNPETNFTRREKSHSLFHWNTLASPELQERIWMFCKNAASMTIGISMDQEICPIIGQVSHSLLYWKRNFQTDICGLGGKVTSRPDHLWPKVGKKCPAEGEAQMVQGRTETRWCQKITRILFHWPWGHGVQRNH